MPKIMKCRNCGNEFEKTGHRYVFCSSECCDNFHHNKYVKKPLERVKCRNCGLEFQQKGWSQIYCSEDCREKAMKLRKLKEKLEKPNFICVWCGSSFKTFKFRRFCSSECRKNHSRITRRIYSIYPFEKAKINRELAKLERLGVNYRFSEPHTDLNDFYRSELSKKAVEV